MYSFNESYQYKRVMKNIYTRVKNPVLILCLSLCFTTSCEKYLDVAPAIDITQKDVFGDFIKYQGFVEEMYQCVPDYTLSRFALMNWNLSNDVVSRQSQCLGYNFDNGNLIRWNSLPYSFFYGFRNVPNSNAVGTDQRRGVWHHGWHGIRLANLAIQNIEMMAGTDEERNLILGQAYFFRGYFHFAILSAWGGIPYISKAFASDDKLDLPRLSYLETAKRVAEDFQKAAEMLPASWDETQAGQRTLGGNTGRVTKGAAYGYLGKNWLYAASPLMNGVETGSYTYNEELARKAADAFNELLKLANQGYHGLEDWPNYHRNFWTMDGSVPRGKEFIWGNPIYTHKRTYFGEHLLQQHGGTAVSYAPVTLELANKFGMKNGLPITEPGSGYDPTKPFANRDPRFDYSLVVDREKILFFTTAFPADATAQFFVGGRHRDQVTTGFGQKKFLGPGVNNRDGRRNDNYYMEVPHMRLAHVYLMYAEAANEGYGGPNGASPGGLTAVEAANVVRTRANVPNMHSRFLTGKAEFRNAIRNETGVEMCLEAHQWYDYRRWHIAHLMENRTKSRLDYNQNWTFFTPVVEKTIVFEEKHYWLPFIEGEVSLYKEFFQNPGW